MIGHLEDEEDVLPPLVSGVRVLDTAECVYLFACGYFVFEGRCIYVCICAWLVVDWLLMCWFAISKNVLSTYAVMMCLVVCVLGVCVPVLVKSGYLRVVLWWGCLRMAVCALGVVYYVDFSFCKIFYLHLCDCL